MLNSDCERIELLERHLRGKVRAGSRGSFDELIYQVLNEANEYDLMLRVQFAREMRKKEKEITQAGAS